MRNVIIGISCLGAMLSTVVLAHDVAPTLEQCQAAHQQQVDRVTPLSARLSGDNGAAISTAVLIDGAKSEVIPGAFELTE